MASSASAWNVCPSDCSCWILDYMTVVWYDGDMVFFSFSAWCIEDWASKRYCDHVVCLCVCLSVKPNPNDILGIRQYIAKYILPFGRNWGRSKFRPNIAKLYGNVYMWVGVAGALHNSDVTIVASTVTSIVTSIMTSQIVTSSVTSQTVTSLMTSTVTSQQWRHEWRHNDAKHAYYYYYRLLSKWQKSLYLLRLRRA